MVFDVNVIITILESKFCINVFSLISTMKRVIQITNQKADLKFNLLCRNFKPPWAQLLQLKTVEWEAVSLAFWPVCFVFLPVQF